MSGNDLLKEGHKAHNFCLPDYQGRKHCLKDYSGQWFVLYFYPKDNTPGCTTEACDFSNEIAEFEKMDCKVIGISPDSAQSHKKFIDKYELNIILLSDENHNTLEKYGVWKLKKNYGKEYMGVVRTTCLINPDGKFAYIWPKVSVKGHVKEVKEKLAELRG